MFKLKSGRFVLQDKYWVPRQPLDRSWIPGQSLDRSWSPRQLYGHFCQVLHVSFSKRIISQKQEINNFILNLAVWIMSKNTFRIVAAKQASVHRIEFGLKVKKSQRQFFQSKAMEVNVGSRDDIGPIFVNGSNLFQRVQPLQQVQIFSCSVKRGTLRGQVFYIFFLF